MYATRIYFYQWYHTVILDMYERERRRKASILGIETDDRLEFFFGLALSLFLLGEAIDLSMHGVGAAVLGCTPRE